MEKPTINISGTVLTMPEPKARIWREIIVFDEERKTIPAVDIVDKCCEVIALAFGHTLTKDDVLDNIEIGDVLPLYFEILRYILEMLTVKIGKKNELEETAAQA